MIPANLKRHARAYLKLQGRADVAAANLAIALRELPPPTRMIQIARASGLTPSQLCDICSGQARMTARVAERLIGASDGK